MIPTSQAASRAVRQRWWQPAMGGGGGRNQHQHHSPARTCISIAGTPSMKTVWKRLATAK